MKHIRPNYLIFLLFISCQGKDIENIVPDNYAITYLERVHEFPYDIYIYKFQNDFVNVREFESVPKGCCNTCDSDCWVEYSNRSEFEDDFVLRHIKRSSILTSNTNINQLQSNLESGKGFLFMNFFQEKPDKARGTFDFCIIDTDAGKLYFFEYINKNW